MNPFPRQLNNAALVAQASELMRLFRGGFRDLALLIDLESTVAELVRRKREEDEHVAA